MQADGLCSGNLPALEDAVVSACREAFQLIDLLQHRGVHPRLGAVDLIPVHPSTEQTSLEECHSLATRVCRTSPCHLPPELEPLCQCGARLECRHFPK